MSRPLAASRMIAPPPAYAALFDQSLASLPGGRDPQVASARRASFARFQALGFPSARVEEWKYSSLAPLAKDARGPALAFDLTPAELAPYRISAPGACRLVFVNGHFAPALSDRLADQAGLSLRPLELALAAGPEPLAEDAAGERGFDALNAAFVTGGMVLELAAGAKAGPIQLLCLHRGGEAPAMVNLRNLVRLGDGAELDLIETHVVEAGRQLLVNLVSRFELGAGAKLRHDRLQLGEIAGSLIGRTAYRLLSASRLTQTLATFGGGFVRNEVDARLDGKGIEAQFNGLYLTRDQQHIDNALRIEHAQPGSISDQFYKGVLDGRAQAAFAGKIVVQRPAQKTNAYQRNNNLLLSPDAEINTKPELEIFADDVKCSHGATAGELDERELFYLRSRGLDPWTARSLLTFAFASEVLERFGDADLQAQAKRELLRWLPGSAVLGDLA